MNKKKIMPIVIMIVGIVAVIIGVASYAYWQLTKKQASPNDMVSACLNFEMLGTSEAITLPSAWPTSDTDGMKHDGYTFTVTNNCTEAVNYTISLESLTSTNTNYLNYDNVRLSLDQNSAITYGTLTTIDNVILEEDTETIRDTKEITTATVAGSDTNTHNIKLWLSSEAPITEQNRSFRSRIRITGGQGIENDPEEIAAVLATGDISKTEECSSDSTGKTTCAPVTGNNVKYTLYDNGNIVISGTGDPKNFEENLVYEILLYVMENNDVFTEEEIYLYKEDESVRHTLGIAFGLTIKDLNKIGVELSNYNDLLIIQDVSESDRPLTISIINKLDSLGILLSSKNIVIEDGVNSLSENMFSYSACLSITMADTVSKIEPYTFNELVVASSFNLPTNITSLEINSLSYIMAPSVDLVLPNSLTQLDLMYGSTFRSIKYPRNDTTIKIHVGTSSSPIVEIIYLPENVVIDGHGFDDDINYISLYVYGPERNIMSTNAAIPQFKEIHWNYTD